MSTTNFIINADDFGMSPEVNEKTEEYAKKGLISSATILANGPSFDAAVKLSRNFSAFSIGAHLNLTQYKSLTNQPVFYDTGITDENGIFTGKLRFSGSIKNDFSRELNKAIFSEWSAQLTKLYDFNICPSHIDGHNHVHYHYGLLPVIKSIQNKYHINKVRMRKIYPLKFYGLFNKGFPRKMPPYPQELYNITWNTLIKYLSPRTKTTDYIFAYISFYRYLCHGVSIPKNCTIELNVHPGCNYMDYFNEENKLLENKTIFKYLETARLISYSDV